MKNFVQPGNTVTVAAPANITSGQGVLVGQLFGVACGDADSGADLDLATTGVFDLPKESEDVFTLGAPVYFDSDAAVCHSHEDTDSNSAGITEALIGVAVAAAGAGATTVRVKLAPSPVTLV